MIVGEGDMTLPPAPPTEEGARDIDLLSAKVGARDTPRPGTGMGAA
jgi:hypothetical protein